MASFLVVSGFPYRRLRGFPDKRPDPSRARLDNYLRRKIKRFQKNVLIINLNLIKVNFTAAANLIKADVLNLSVDTAPEFF